MQKTAERLLNKYDCRKSIKFVRNNGSINPSTGEFDQSSGQEITVNGVTSTYADRLINETTVLTGDIRLAIDSNVEPKQSDDVLIDGDQYSIIAIDKKNAGGIVVSYILQLRK
jgi:hypothetical protein